MASLEPAVTPGGPTSPQPPEVAPPESAATFAGIPGETAGDPARDCSLPGANAPALPDSGRLGHYEIKALLGVGGMGAVFRAHDPRIERDVAIKLLSRPLVSNATIRGRFLFEAKAVGRLNHPHVVVIHEIGQVGDDHFLVLEYLPGGTVAARLDKQGPFSVLDATRIAAEACRGVEAAHRAGIIHRDLKPGNLLFAADGTVKVADFGLAKGGLTANPQVTQAGQVLGTPGFMSPEQCEGGAVDHRTDVYALGATYYSLLTGADPYANAGSIVQILYSHCHAAVPDPRAMNPLVPDACASIITRAMAKRPEDRYQSVAEMLADLNAVLSTMSGAGIVLPSAVQPSATRPASAQATPVRDTLTRRRVIFAACGLAALAGIGGVCFRNAHVPPSRQTTAVPAGGPATSRTAPVAATGAPLRVGVLHSLSGTLASSESPVVDATLLAIEEVNAAGGLLGRPVEAVIRDGRSDAPSFALEAERLIDSEEVSTVFGCWTSASRKTVVPIFEAREHLLIYPVQYEGIEESPNVIYMGATPNQQIIPAVQWAYDSQQKRRFYLIGSDYVFPRTAHAVIRDTLDRLGGEVVGEEYVSLGETVTKAMIDRLVASAPDVVLNTINGDSNLSFFRELRRAGVTPQRTPTISFSIGEVEMRSLDLSQMAGDFAAWNYFQSLASEQNREFVRAFQVRYGPQRVVSDPMEAAYVGVMLWAAAVRECGSDRPADIRRAIRNLRFQAPEGEVRVDPATQHAFKIPRIGKITSSGQFEVVWTAAKPEGPQPYPPSRTAEQWKAFLNDLYTGWGNRWAAPAP
jgi:urea transport system substrate-binding protein